MLPKSGNWRKKRSIGETSKVSWIDIDGEEMTVIGQIAIKGKEQFGGVFHVITSLLPR
jgi:hypothetical protein